jgi:hypothetical protein
MNGCAWCRAEIMVASPAKIRGQCSTAIMVIIITLRAEVAGLTISRKAIPPWINEKIAGILRVKPSLYESSHPG